MPLAARSDSPNLRVPPTAVAGAVAVLCLALPAAAQLDLDNCRETPRAFRVNGTLQAHPCPLQVMSAAAIGSKVLYACHYGGAVLCDGDGSGSSPADCVHLGFFGCSPGPSGLQPIDLAQVKDVSFSPDGRALYVACYTELRRCDWDAAAGAAMNCAKVQWADCPGIPPFIAEDEVTGVVVPRDSPSYLVIACDSMGMRICPLTTPGSGKLAANCSYGNSLDQSPCFLLAQFTGASNMHHNGISLDLSNAPKLHVGCAVFNYTSCDLNVAASPAVANCTLSNCTNCLDPPPCHVNALVQMPSGHTAVMCTQPSPAGFYYICGPTVSPSASPTLHPTAAIAPSAPPSAPPRAGPSYAPLTATPSFLPSAAPTGTRRSSPTAAPTSSGGLPSDSPVRVAMLTPTAQPNEHVAPNAQPSTSQPAVAPSPVPTGEPTAAPTQQQLPGRSAVLDAFAGTGGATSAPAILAAMSGTSSSSAQVAMALDMRCDEDGVLTRIPPLVLHPTQLDVAGSAHMGCLLGGTIIIAGVLLMSCITASLLRRYYADADGLLSSEKVERSTLRRVPTLSALYGCNIAAVARHPSATLAAVSFLYQGMCFAAMRLLVGHGQSFGRRVAGMAGTAAALVYPLWLRRRVLAGVQVVPPEDGAPAEFTDRPLARVRPWDAPRPPAWLQGAVLSERGDWVSRRRTHHWVNSWQLPVRPFMARGAAGAVTAELLAMWALGLASAPGTPSHSACGNVRVAAAAVVLLQAAYAVCTCPYRALRDAVLDVVRSVTVAAALLALAADFYGGGDIGALATALLEIAAVLALLRAGITILAEVLLLAGDWREHSQSLEWDEPDPPALPLQPAARVLSGLQPEATSAADPAAFALLSTRSDCPAAGADWGEPADTLLDSRISAGLSFADRLLTPHALRSTSDLMLGARARTGSSCTTGVSLLGPGTSPHPSVSETPLQAHPLAREAGLFTPPSQRRGSRPEPAPPPPQPALVADAAHRSVGRRGTAATGAAAWTPPRRVRERPLRRGSNTPQWSTSSPPVRSYTESDQELADGRSTVPSLVGPCALSTSDMPSPLRPPPPPVPPPRSPAVQVGDSDGPGYSLL